MWRKIRELNPLHLLIIIFIIGWLFLLSAQKIDLTTADLGRHLKNGEEILASHFQVLTSNYYSYTESDFPFVNHHYGSGVIFHLIFQLLGFNGLSWFYIVLTGITFLIIFYLSQKESNFLGAILASLLVIPLIVSRVEIRPEGLSYFFIVIFIFIFWGYQKKIIKTPILFVLPILQLIWVNVHIYFFWGILITGFYWLISLIKTFLKKERKYKRDFGVFTMIGLLIICVSLINPFGVKGLLYPLQIFQNYGYRLVENESLWFSFKVNLVIFSLSLLFFSWSLIKKRKNFFIPELIFTLIAGVMSLIAIRNFSLFGLLLLPVLSVFIKAILDKITKFKLSPKVTILMILMTFILIVSFYSTILILSLHLGKVGIGLASKNESAATFIKEQNLKGPIFNNYDIGGYLIYYLYPTQKVFVDNRPETYSNKFFTDIYIPMQEDEKQWQNKSNEYNFQTIIFAYHDATPWAQTFLVNRIDDQSWVPVFADSYVLIFIKDTDQNRELIDKYRIPRENFSVLNNH